MKNLFKNFLAMGLIALAIPAAAQNIGLYSPVPGAGIVLPALTTNVFYVYPLTNGVVSGTNFTTNTFGVQGTTNAILQSVQDYNDAGVTFSYTSGSNATVQLYRSYDFGNTFEKTAGYSYGQALTNATAFSTNASITLTDVTTLAVVVGNASNLQCSNCLVEVNLKAIRQQIQQAGLQPSTAGPVPSITSTNWTP